MNATDYERLFGWRHAFDHPATILMTALVAGALVAGWIAIAALSAAGKLKPELRRELVQRVGSWCVIVPALLIPILLGAFWAMLAIAALSLICYREFARATGLFRHARISVCVFIAFLLIFLSILDNWYNLFVAMAPLGICFIAAFSISSDQPKGYIQRTALGTFGFLYFGVCLGHLGFMAVDADYRPIILMLLICTQLNDVYAYVCGRTFGRRKFAPNTSPNKTVGGSLGAIVLTTATTYALGLWIYRGTPVGGPIPLLSLGLIISIAGQMGDLMLSSIKRDLGIKDMGMAIPGHGGFLDRFDSLILVAPAVFHFVGFFRGFGAGQTVEIFTHAINFGG